MNTQTPILKPPTYPTHPIYSTHPAHPMDSTHPTYSTYSTYLKQPEQTRGNSEMDSIKLLAAAVALAIFACLLAVAISTAICTYMAPVSEFSQAVAK